MCSGNYQCVSVRSGISTNRQKTFANVVWHPYLQKDIISIEQIQMIATFERLTI